MNEITNGSAPPLPQLAKCHTGIRGLDEITGGGPQETTDLQISSLIDTWLLLRDIELGGERNRGLYILKSRGMAHSNQIREFGLTDHGIDLIDAYLGPEGVLTGSMRLAQEARESAVTGPGRTKSNARST